MIRLILMTFLFSFSNVKGSAQDVSPILDFSEFAIEAKIKIDIEQLAQRGGTQDGGGGDPRAIRVLEFGRRALVWLLSNPHPGFEVSEIDLHYRLKYLSHSLKSVPLIKFPEVNSIECQREIKKGCTYADGSIAIAGLYWDRLSTKEKERCELSLIELLRTQNIDKPYEKAAELCRVIDTVQITVVTPVCASSATGVYAECVQPDKNLKLSVAGCRSQRGIDAIECIAPLWFQFKRVYPACVEKSREFCLNTCRASKIAQSCVAHCNQR